MKFAANAQLLINYNQSLKHNWLIFVSNSECIDGDGDGQAGWMDCSVSCFVLLLVMMMVFLG